MTNLFVSPEEAAVQMHRGVGSESLLRAAGAWGVAAQKLATTAEEMLLVITQYDGQYWQSPAAQQARDALTSVIQGLKNNAVVAGQIETAATEVAAAFGKARAVTPTPQQVKNNRQTRAQWAATDGVLGLHQSVIAELDTAYEVMWLGSITAHDSYYYDTSHALKRVKQPWSPPHQQPADAPTTVGGHPPTPDAPDIASPITQHRDTAEWARLYALSHALRTIEHQQAYEQHSTYAKTCESLAGHGKATAELYNDMAQHHREAAQLHQDLSLGQTDISTLAQKYVDIATTWHQTKQQMQKTIDAYHAASKTQPYLQELENNLSEIKKNFAGSMEHLFLLHRLGLENLDLRSYTNSLQGLSEDITDRSQAQWEARLHESNADTYARAAADIQGCALNHAEESDNAWRAAQQHAQPIIDHAHDFFVLLQKAARQDHQATTLAGSPA